MIVLVCSLQWAECGQTEGHLDVLQAFVYGGIVVYVVSLPARVGGLFLIALAALVLLVAEALTAVTLLAPDVFSASSFQSGAFCYLYAAVFLCEPRFAAWLDNNFCPTYRRAAEMEESDERRLSQEERNDGDDDGHRDAVPRYVYSRYPILTKSEQIRQQQLIQQQRQQQALLEEQERAQLQQQQQQQQLLRLTDSPTGQPKSTIRCKFPVKTSSASGSKRII